MMENKDRKGEMEDSEGREEIRREERNRGNVARNRGLDKRRGKGGENDSRRGLQCQNREGRGRRGKGSQGTEE